MSDDEKPVAKFLRLRTGDDLISEVMEIEDDEGIRYTLFHPFKVVYVPVEHSGYLSINFMPWVFPRICDAQEFTIDSSDVMLIEDVTQKMNTYYWESVNSDKKEEQEQSEDSEESSMDEKTLLEILNHMRNKRIYH